MNNKKLSTMRGQRSVAKNQSVSVALLVLPLLASATTVRAQSVSKLQSVNKPNVLLIMVDDLRPDLGCYGNPIIKTPHFDQLAAQGRVFTRQYANVPTCGASRHCLLTGKLPHSRAALTNEVANKFIANQPLTGVPETFVDNLRRHGYYTVGIGKISHSADGYLYDYNQPKSNSRELPYSWNEMLFDPGKWRTGWNAFFGYADGSDRTAMKSMVKPYENGKVGDEGYPDGLTAQLAVQQLEKLGKNKQPFVLGVGFFKPHLPFTAPKKYWDLYDEASLPLTPSPDIPENVNIASLTRSNEFNSYKLGEEKPALSQPVSPAYARRLIRGYYASVSYIDAQAGRVLAALKKQGLDKNTIVVVWGDHGWNLGDHRGWGKHTLSERSLRSALIVKTPVMKTGQTTDGIVSGVDLYPTLMELCGVPMPYAGEGKSYAALLSEDMPPATDNVAYGYFNNGITMRTSRYRLTRYFRQQQPLIELYDHQNDPNENRNIAAEKPEIVAQLLPRLEKGDTGLYRTKE